MIFQDVSNLFFLASLKKENELFPFCNMSNEICVKRRVERKENENEKNAKKIEERSISSHFLTSLLFCKGSHLNGASKIEI